MQPQEIKVSPDKIIGKLQSIIGMQSVKIAMLESEIERLNEQKEIENNG
jgi:uncharacterized small protein (DUF1192 family)